MAQPKTKKPTGVTIARNQYAFTASWTKSKTKIGNKNYDYKKQYAKYGINLNPDHKKRTGTWTDLGSIGKGSSYNFLNINYGNYYPYTNKTIDRICFYVRGDTDKSTKSDVVQATDYNFSVPSNASVSMTEGTYPSATFSFSVSADNGSGNVFTRFDCYTRVVENGPNTTQAMPYIEDNAYLIKNSSGTSPYTNLNGAEGYSNSWTFGGEDTSGWANNSSHTRWFYVVPRGPHGNGGAAVSYITWANPDKPSVSKPADSESKKTVDDKGSYLSVYYAYKILRSFARPVTSVQPEYIIGSPTDSSLEPPSSGWTSLPVIQPPNGFASFDGKSTFNTSSGIEDNKCLWVRVTSKYSDKQPNANAISDPVLFYKGKLSSPTNVGCGVIDTETFRAIASATNNTNISGSFTAIYKVDKSEEYCIGIIPYGKTQTTIQFDKLEINPDLRFYTMVGSYSTESRFIPTEDREVDNPEDPGVAAKQYFELEDGEYYLVDPSPSADPKEEGWYEIDGKSLYSIGPDPWQSDPVNYTVETKTPTRITASRTDISGTIKVSWDWPWKSADIAEISWADHADAWQSTSEPSKYEISSIRASYWNISGLENGKVWYIRVRLGVKQDDGNIDYGPYSKIYSLNLTSAPATPLIDIPLDKKVILKDEEVTISWVYSSEDGQPQQSATLYEVVEESGQEVYKTLMTTGEEQYIIINSPNTPKAKMNWDVGETHTFVVRVQSMAGNFSGYSNKQSVTIADPIQCMIVDSSFDDGVLKEMPITFKVIDGYFESNDTVVDETKTYYSGEDDGEYVYSEVEESQDPEWEPNPSECGWYELSGENYILTEDTSIVEGKQYYTRSGDAKWVYTEIEDPIGSPKTNGYFERKNLDSKIKISASITRSEQFPMNRPDDSTVDGYKDETIYAGESSDGSFLIDVTSVQENQSLVGSLDDRCHYELNAYIKDDLGQSGKAEPIPFVVNWDHQAGFPGAKVEIDDEYSVAFLTPLAPHSSIEYILTEDQEVDPTKKYYILELVSDPNIDNIDNYLEYVDSVYLYTTDSDLDPEKTYYTVSLVETPVTEDLGSYYEYEIKESARTDVCDIYRLSVDKPELIYSGAQFDQTYVDPYPTIGEYGGHRFVCRTLNGDYITEDNTIAWVDTGEEDGDRFDTHANIVDFDGKQAFLLYEVDLSSSWSKDFQETHYLGGSVQGDWNPSVQRTSSMNVTAVSDYDQEMIRTMHELANYTGICHVRTKDGSSYSADVQVNETYEYTRAPRFNKYDLSITRVDSETYDCVTLQEWLSYYSEESE